MKFIFIILFFSLFLYGCPAKNEDGIVLGALKKKYKEDFVITFKDKRAFYKDNDIINRLSRFLLLQPQDYYEISYTIASKEKRFFTFDCNYSTQIDPQGIVSDDYYQGTLDYEAKTILLPALSGILTEKDEFDCRVRFPIGEGDTEMYYKQKKYNYFQILESEMKREYSPIKITYELTFCDFPERKYSLILSLYKACNILMHSSISNHFYLYIKYYTEKDRFVFYFDHYLKEKLSGIQAFKSYIMSDNNWSSNSYRY